MGAEVDQFCDKLRDRLNAIEAWLQSVKTDIQSLSGKVRDDLRNKWEQAHTKLHAQKEHVEQTRAELKSPPHLATELLVDAVVGWKPPPAATSPAASPDVTEAHTAAAIDHAVAGIDEVRDAMLSAALARLPAAGK